MLSSVSGRHHVDADPDPAFHFVADADSDPDPSNLMQIRIWIPTTHFFPDFGPLMLQNDPLRLPHFHFDADPDPAFQIDADPDPDFHFYADPDQVSKNDADPCGIGTLALRPLFHYWQ